MDALGNTVYRELHAMARGKLAAQRAGHTLQATALVNEAWLKLHGHFPDAKASPQFFKTAADAMRQILIDHARAKHRLKRGGDAKREADAADVVATEDGDYGQILALNEALSQLEKLDPQAASVVKLKFFGGLSVEETAAALDLSERTVKRDWQFARTWLAGQLGESGAGLGDSR